MRIVTRAATAAVVLAGAALLAPPAYAADTPGGCQVTIKPGGGSPAFCYFTAVGPIGTTRVSSTYNGPASASVFCNGVWVRDSSVVVGAFMSGATNYKHTGSTAISCYLSLSVGGSAGSGNASAT